MPIEHVGEQPPCMLFFGSLLTLWRNVSGEPGDKILNTLLAFVYGLARRAISDVWPGNRFSAGLKLRPKLFQPIPETERRNAVVTVVVLDNLPHINRDRLNCVEFQRTLERMQIRRRVAEFDLARETVELLR